MTNATLAGGRRRAAASREPFRADLRSRRRAGIDPRAVLVTIAAGGVAVVALWWFHTPAVSGLGGWLTNAGRITGLLAGYGVVVLIALMARLPPLERGIGSDRLARWHAHGGRYVVSLVVVHALLITWGYSVLSHTGVIQQASTFLLSYPDVLMASVAGLILVMVGIVSARAARRRLRYETWFYLHFYTYLAVALAFSHQFAVGAEFLANRAARVVWSAMYIAVGAAILWYRFLTPLLQARRHQMRIVGVQREARQVYSIVIGGRDLDRLHAEPGQYFRFRFLTRDLWWSANPYSLSAAPRPDMMRITVKNLGDHSRLQSRLRPGVRVIAEGPYGALTAARRSRRKVLLIAGGIGITPMRALLESMPGAPGDITLLYRVSNPRDVVFGKELETIAAERGAVLHIVTGTRRRLRHDPLSAKALLANFPDLRHYDVFLCGPDPMMTSVQRSLRAARVPRSHIHFESFEL